MAAARIQGFDGVRAIAVIFVYVQHSNDLATRFPLGEIGVWSFFVLSGFLIIRILHAAKIKIESGLSSFFREFGRFLGHRTVRIFPIYYLVLAIASLLVLSGKNIEHFTANWALSYWTYLTNIQIERANELPGIFTHLWSLSIEEQFYVLAAPLFLLLPSRYFIPLLISTALLGLIRRLYIVDPLGMDSISNAYMLALGGFAGLLADKVTDHILRRIFFAVSILLIIFAAAEIGLTYTNHYTLTFVHGYSVCFHVPQPRIDDR